MKSQGSPQKNSHKPVRNFRAHRCPEFISGPSRLPAAAEVSQLRWAGHWGRTEQTEMWSGRRPVGAAAAAGLRGARWAGGGMGRTVLGDCPRNPACWLPEEGRSPPDLSRLPPTHPPTPGALGCQGCGPQMTFGTLARFPAPYPPSWSAERCSGFCWLGALGRLQCVYGPPHPQACPALLAMLIFL